MTNAENDGLGYECHDCGELYGPDADLSDCMSQGHYVGPLSNCALPFARPRPQD